MNLPALSQTMQIALLLTSWLIVAFGQPAWHPILGLAASMVGYAIFWRVLLCYPTKTNRFILSTVWFTAVQLVQLSWFLAHPYWYIYSVYFVLSLLMGLQFGVIGIFIDSEHLKRYRSLTAIACLWVLFEWSRLFLLSGFSWNPAGLALTSTIYSMQLASVFGVFGLSFWVVLSNLFFLRAWERQWPLYPTLLGFFMMSIPFLFGIAHLKVHEHAVAFSTEKPFRAALVQTAFPVEEEMGLGHDALIAYVTNEWRQILTITKKQKEHANDLIILPEFVVPYGTYSFVYPYDDVKKAFHEVLGEESLKSLPPLEFPFAMRLKTDKINTKHYVNNAFWAQAIANYHKTGLLIGLEDADRVADNEVELYSAALFFLPEEKVEADTPFPAGRYEKRVLVPMGEYIPFSFCRTLASAYGVNGSFTKGKEAKVFQANGTPFGVSICYEETFGNIVRENKNKGAHILANITNDAWYPNSRLTQQHFDHARLRTVECGIPLIRACNTGVTGAIDSLGRVIATVGDHHRDAEWVADSLHVEVPRYSYTTLYSKVGDMLIVGFSLLWCLFFLRVNSKLD